MGRCLWLVLLLWPSVGSFLNKSLTRGEKKAVGKIRTVRHSGVVVCGLGSQQQKPWLKSKLAPFYVEFAFCPHSCVGFFQVSSHDPKTTFIGLLLIRTAPV